MAKIIFAGTPEFSVSTLQALLDSEHEVVAVYTQPDRRAGRGRQPQPSPVKQAAVSAGVPVCQPATLRDSQALAELQDWQADLMVVVAYGLLLPKSVLETPRLGCVNVHASLLPRWRGAAPIQRAIEAGDCESGVCIMQMDEGLDTGPVWHRVSQRIDEQTTGALLHDQLAVLGAQALMRALPRILLAADDPEPQAEEGATYARKLHKQDAWLDWRRSATELSLQVRAFNPVPVAQAKVEGETLRVWQATAIEQACDAKAGTVLTESSEGIDVATGDGVLRLLCLQPAGKKAMPVAAFVNGRSLLGKHFEIAE
ncbi:MAG: methionyl-tRNA formyltransferase [Granulosicoccaceae bacterium]